MSNAELTAKVGRLAQSYFWGWHDENYEQLRSILCTDVKFEDPNLGSIDGIDAHIGLYANSQRFPNLKGVAAHRFANSEDVAFISYDVYISHWRTVAVIDQLTVREGCIVHVLSVTSEWPSRHPGEDLSHFTLTE
jgi:hypothetical protein